LEVFDYDVAKKSIIGPADLALRFAQDMRKEYDNFGLLVDLSHLPLVRESAKYCLTTLKDYIIHAHIGNAVAKDPSLEGYGDEHQRFGFPTGDNDVPELVEFLKVLFEIGFIGGEKRPIISFEVKPWKDEDPDIIIANSKRTLDEAWAKLEI
jgi:sugar phosphate isomerase/epimerase